MTTIAGLLDTMNGRGIRYVHWKSNKNIEQALAGKEDLDILVHPDDRVSLEGILAELQVVRVYSRKDDWQPHIYHYIGMDSSARALVHAHIHYALTVGFDYCKNYVLPIGPAYLQNATFYRNMPLPEPEKEFYVLVLRLLLKNGLVPFLVAMPTQQLRIIRGGSKATIGGGGFKEYEDLKGRVDRARLQQLIESEFALIPATLFAQCEEVIERGASIGRLLQVARAVERALAPHAVHSQIGFGLHSFARLNGDRLGRVHSRLTGWPKGKLLGEGRMIAFIGGDGAGKSTNVGALGKTLSRQLAVKTFHVGRPGRSFTGMVLKAGKMACRALGMSSIASALDHVALAFDRRAEFDRADQLRQRGGVAILDRMPLPHIRSMDAPRIPQMTRRTGPVIRYLESLEQRIYASLGRPDQFFVLKVDPRIAAQRRQEDDQAALSVRSGEVWTAEWPEPAFRVFDTGAMNADEIAQRVCAAAWNTITRDSIRVELVGLPCSGKSTLTKAALAALPNAQQSLPYKRPLGMLLLRLPHLLAAFVSAYVRTGNAQLAKNYAQLDHAFALLQYWKERGSPARNMVLDQSILFQLAMSKKEGLLTSISEQQAGLVRDFLQRAFYLTADRNELVTRLQQRSRQAGRAQGDIQRADFEEFCKGYEAAFQWVFAAVGVPVTVLQTGNTDVASLRAALLDSTGRQ